VTSAAPDPGAGIASAPGNPQFPVLDTLRAVGALAVLTTHTSFQAGDYARHGVWGTVLARLDIGVAIFFVLSGFLLSRPHLTRAAVGLRGPDTGRYYWKRALRIYPLYAVTVVVALGLLPENHPTRAADWVSSLLLADTYTDDALPHGLTQMWSLAAEVAFYLVLPVLMTVALGRVRSFQPRRVAATLAAMTATSIAWHLWLADAVDERLPGMPGTWLPAYLTWFAVGIGLAAVHVSLADPRTPPGRLARLVSGLGAMPGVCWTLGAGLMLVASTPLAGPALLQVGTRTESLSKHLLYAAVGGLVVLTGVFVQEASRYQALMSLRLPRHLGHISYGLFCIHLSVLAIVMEVGDYELFRGNGATLWALTLAISLLVAELLYRSVELPAMRLRDLGRGRRATDAAAEARAPAQDTTTR
jgi:peptidoglycan/LPS O-acetylase OafA/YrhL